MKGSVGKKIIAIVGMAGSGKTEVAALLKEKGLPMIRFGNETQRGLKAKGLPVSEENERAYREQIRRELGMAAYAIKALPRINRAFGKADTIVIDGLYSWEEYLYLKQKLTQLTLIAVITQASIRYTRLKDRSKRSLSELQVRQRDIDEIEKLNKGGPIALADYVIENNGTIDELKQKTEALLQQLGIP